MCSSSFLLLFSVFFTLDKTVSTISDDDKSCLGPDLMPGKCSILEQCPSIFRNFQDNPNDADFNAFLNDSHAICDYVNNEVSIYLHMYMIIN